MNLSIESQELIKTKVIDI